MSGIQFHSGCRWRGVGCQEQLLDDGGRERAIEPDAAVADERLAEVAATHEIHVLLHLDDVVRAELVQGLRDLRREVGRNHRREVRLAQVLQPVHGELPREFMEVQRLVVLLQVFVMKVIVLHRADVLELALQ